MESLARKFDGTMGLVDPGNLSRAFFAEEKIPTEMVDVFFRRPSSAERGKKISGFFGISQFHSPLTYTERERERFFTCFLVGGFKYFLFSSLFGEMIQFDECFSNGLVQPPTSVFHYQIPGREIVFLDFLCQYSYLSGSDLHLLKVVGKIPSQFTGCALMLDKSH